jgi:hypothetical protein
MTCPTCKASTLHELQHHGWLWCSSCGSAIEMKPTGAIAFVMKPNRAMFQPGLLAVAADATKQANDLIAKVDAASILKDSAIVRAVEALGEAVSAIVSELQAREGEKTSSTARAIAAGIDAVVAERERCAKLAEGATLGNLSLICTSCPALKFPSELAARIRKVP